MAKRTQTKETTTWIDTLDETDLEASVFDEEPRKPRGPLNLATVAGLGFLAASVIFVLQVLGLVTFDFGLLPIMLSIAGAVLVLLIGSGVLLREPRRKRRPRKKKVARARKPPSAAKKPPKPRQPKKPAKPRPSKKPSPRKEKSGRMRKSSDKMVWGVCGGLADELGVDVTLVRLAFVIGTLTTAGTAAPIAYLLFNWFMGPAKEDE